MEISTQSLSYAKAKANSPSPAYFPAKSTVFSPSSVSFLGYNCLPRKLKCSARLLRSFGAVRASDSENGATNNSVRWLLEPVGDGDTRHIGFKTAMPSSFEIASNVVTVGRIAGKADIVLPIPTVSGLHARIQKTEECLLITDLESTNGTFIDETRLQPGIVASASPGNLITFGDTNLAIFKVSKLERKEFLGESEKSAEGEGEDDASNISESTS